MEKTFEELISEAKDKMLSADGDVYDRLDEAIDYAQNYIDNDDWYDEEFSSEASYSVQYAQDLTGRKAERLLNEAVDS